VLENKPPTRVQADPALTGCGPLPRNQKLVPVEGLRQNRERVIGVGTSAKAARLRGYSETGVVITQSLARQHRNQKLAASYGVLKALIIVQRPRGRKIVS